MFISSLPRYTSPSLSHIPTTTATTPSIPTTTSESVVVINIGGEEEQKGEKEPESRSVETEREEKEEDNEVVVSSLPSKRNLERKVYRYCAKKIHFKCCIFSAKVFKVLKI